MFVTLGTGRIIVHQCAPGALERRLDDQAGQHRRGYLRMANSCELFDACIDERITLSGDVFLERYGFCRRNCSAINLLGTSNCLTLFFQTFIDFAKVAQCHLLGLSDHQQLGHWIVDRVVDKREPGRLDFCGRVEPRRAEEKPGAIGMSEELAAQTDTGM